MHDDGDLDAGGAPEDQSPADPAPPHETVADKEDGVVEAGQLDGDVHETAFEVEDELHDSFPVEQLATPIGPDGLPDHSAEKVLAGALPHTIEAVTCIADERQYVELFAEELLERGWVLEERGEDEDEDAEPWARSIWSPPYYRSCRVYAKIKLDVRGRFDMEGQPRLRRTFGPDEIERKWDEAFGPGFVPTRPVREKCKHYQRQHFGREAQPDPDQPGHNMFFLMCTHPSRRSIAGAAMRLNNEAIYGCDLRDPFDSDGVARMNDFYDAKIRDRPDKRRLPMFGLAGDEVYDDEPPGGIFNG